MELDAAIRRRHMCRDFSGQPVDPEVVDELLALARLAPSAGFSQGFSFVVLEGSDQTSRFWDATLPSEKRASFPWPGLLSAPVLVIPMADPQAYVDRYGEPDKARTGLGRAADDWPIPYWYVDAAMATQNLLLAVVDRGLGALFFGIFEHEVQLLAELGVPSGMRAIGAVAIGHPVPGSMRSAQGSARTRTRRPMTDVIHRGRW